MLLDYDLDDGKGTSLVAFLQQLPTVPAVVATSAHEDGNRLLLAAGADATCPKGRFAEISAVLARVVAVRGCAEPSVGAIRRT